MKIAHKKWYRHLKLKSEFRVLFDRPDMPERQGRPEGTSCLSLSWWSIAFYWKKMRLCLNSYSEIEHFTSSVWDACPHQYKFSLLINYTNAHCCWCWLVTGTCNPSVTHVTHHFHHTCHLYKLFSRTTPCSHTTYFVMENADVEICSFFFFLACMCATSLM